MVGSSSKRAPGVDELRGISISLLVFINIYYAAVSPDYYRAMTGGDTTVWLLVTVLGEGTLRYMFYLLWGLSLGYVYLKSAEFNYRKYVKRMSVILALGLINTFVLLWPEDILVTFAVSSIVMLPLLRVGTTYLLIACLFLALCAYSFYGVFVLEPLEEMRASGSQALAADWDKYKGGLDRKFVEMAAYMTQGYLVVFRETFTGIKDEIFSLFLVEIWETMIVVLLGVVAYQAKIVSADLRKTLIAGTILTLIGLVWVCRLNLGYVTGLFDYIDFGLRTFSWEYLLSHLILAVGYSLLILSAVRASLFQSTMRVFSGLGRFSLTIYLSHSLFFLMVFVVMKQYNRFGGMELFAISAAIAMMTGWVCWKLYKQGRQGPAEYLSKCLYAEQ